MSRYCCKLVVIKEQFCNFTCTYYTYRSNKSPFKKVSHMLSFDVSSCPCSLNAFEITFIQSILQLKPIVSVNEIVQCAASLYYAIAKLRSYI
jgi:hypothetical protein